MQAAAPDAHVVAAFHLVPAAALGDLDHHARQRRPGRRRRADARATVLDLIDGIPACAPSTPARWPTRSGIETFAAALLTVNLRHKGEGSLRLEGIGPRRTPTP